MIKKKGMPDAGEARDAGMWQERIQFLCDSMEATSQPFVAGYPDGRMFMCNNAFSELTGYTGEELLKSVTWSVDLTPQEWREREAGALATLYRTGKAQRYEKEYFRKDGTRIPVELLVHEAVDRKGNLLFYFAFVNDISGRMRMENALQWANRALKALSKCKEAMIRAKDEATLLNDICHIIVNEGGYRLAWIGYIEDDEQRTVRPVARAGYDDGYVDNLKIALNDPVRSSGPTGISLKTGKPYGSRNVKADAEMQPWRQEALKRGYLSTLNLPVIYEDQILGTLVIYSGRPGAFEDEELGLLEDLAENLAYGVKAIRDRVRRDKAEKELQRSRDELEVKVRERTGQLTEAKAQAELYLDLLSHDINNMNHAAMGFLELALMTLESDKRLSIEDKNLVENPLKALQSSSRLIDNVRKLQRLVNEGVKTRQVDLGDIFREMDVQELLSLDRDVTISIPSDSRHMVEANELLRDVFYNLISNAVKHSDEEQPLTVDVKVESVSENGRAYYRCVVEDNGPGIPDELKQKLFNRFRRGATKAHGKGLGLYLVRTLVEGYHGRVWVEDRVPGDHTKGSRFVVMLPAVEAPG